MPIKGFIPCQVWQIRNAFTGNTNHEQYQIEIRDIQFEGTELILLKRGSSKDRINNQIMRWKAGSHSTLQSLLSLAPL